MGPSPETIPHAFLSNQGCFLWKEEDAMKRTIKVCTAAAAALFAGAAVADVTVYNRDHFAGPSLTLRGEQRDLEGSGFYDSISSIEVHQGRWQFCSQPNFAGDCAV